MSDDFCAAIHRGCESKTAYGLAQALLELCAQRKAPLANLSGPERSALAALVGRAASFIEDRWETEGEGCSVQLYPEDAADIVDASSSWSDELALRGAARIPLLARAWAEALADTLKQNLWVSLLRGGGKRGVVFRPGEAVPVCEPDMKGRLFERLGARPERLAPPIHGTRWLALLGAEAEPYAIRMFLDRDKALSALHKASRVGVALPLRGSRSLVMTRDAARKEIICAGPRRAARARRRLVRQVERARREGVEVLVLPELCLDEGAVAQLRYLHRAGRLPPVVMAGSRHAQVRGHTRNRALAFVGAREVHHDKNNAFSTRDGWQEGIVTEPNELTLVVSGSWSVCTLVCKDLLEPITYRALSDLRARFVLVSALSPSLKDFAGPVAQLTGWGQGVCVIANVTDETHEACALVATPVPDAEVWRRTAATVRLPATLDVTFDTFRCAREAD